MKAHAQLLVAGVAVAYGGANLFADESAYDLRYKFKTGDVVRYEVKHRMNVRSTIEKKTQQASSQTNSVKVWKIVDVLPGGEIELINLVERVHMKNKLPDKDELEFDSRAAGDPPPGFEDAAKAIGVPISSVRMTPSGEIVQREMKVHQPAADLNAPIAERLPEEPLQVGDTWNEPLEVTIQLQAGGQKVIQARRHYELTSVDHGVATFDVDYQVLSPVTPHIEAQLVQRLLKGTVRFDINAGHVVTQKMDVDQRVLGFAGPTSSMHYVMSMEEKLIPGGANVAQRSRED